MFINFEFPYPLDCLNLMTDAEKVQSDGKKPVIRDGYPHGFMRFPSNFEFYLLFFEEEEVIFIPL